MITNFFDINEKQKLNVQNGGSNYFREAFEKHLKRTSALLSFLCFFTSNFVTPKKHSFEQK